MSSATPVRNVSPKTAGNSTAKRSAKTSKPSKVIRLHLPSAVLARYASTTLSQVASTPPKSSVSSTSTPVIHITEDGSPAENASESNATPVPSAPDGLTVAAVLPEGDKKKGVPGPKPGYKRGSGPAVPRARGKPGPKRKKGGADDGTNTNGDTGPTKRGAGANSGHPAPHRLGPKANQGAINAGLRALDRTGKPCRRWEKKVFQVKSFTGVTWDVPTWRAPKPKVATVEDALPGGAPVPAPATVDGKENNKKGVPDSEKSSSAADVAVSSPAPPVAASG